MRGAIALLFLALGLGVAACGGDDATDPASSSESLTAAQELADAAGDAAEAQSSDASPEDAEPPDPTAVSDATEPPTDGAAGGELVTCELETYPSQVPLDDGSVHIDGLPDGFAYNSVPASQGPHDPQWLRWGIYDEPLPEINAVHNLEHGGMTAQYGFDVPAETVAQIEAWYAEDPNAVLVAPYEALGADVALAAWTVEDIDQGSDEVYRSSQGNVLRCNGFDERSFSEFREGFRGRAPERIPLDRMPPGS